MADQRPPLTVSLDWDGELRFTGRAGEHTVVLDGRSRSGPSPMTAVAFGLAGCMAMDVANILTRGRHPLGALHASLAGHRADAQPPRFVAFDLHFVVSGAVPPDAVERAVQLSREKYCSVWRSLRQDITLTVTHEIRQA